MKKIGIIIKDVGNLKVGDKVFLNFEISKSFYNVKNEKGVFSNLTGNLIKWVK